MPRTSLLGTAALLMVGCSFTFESPKQARISCAQDGDCPPARQCLEGLCRQAGDPCVDSTAGALTVAPDGARCALGDGDGVCGAGQCLPSRCGDRIVAAALGEQCDDGGETARCDADCTAPACGDGVKNAAAGERCDDGGESARCDADCSEAACGDGAVNAAAGEQCDTSGASQECDDDCTLPRCGDGTVNLAAFEACDDGGETAACDADCTPARCGDLTVNAAAGEQCDGDGETALCNADCTAASCGDGVVNRTAGEACDDGGESATCNADCTLARCGDLKVNAAAGELCDGGGETAGCNAGCTLARCGDGTINRTAGEACDDGGESASCNADCTAARCGDRKVNAAAGELCDGGGETAGCNTGCTLARCGDRILNRAAGEQCDDGGESAACNADCTAAHCGDAALNLKAGEQCDLGPLNSDAPDATCRPGCTLSSCGDGIRDASHGELCDGADLGGEDCVSRGRYPGKLACGATCQFVLAACGGRCGDGVRDAAFEECDGEQLGEATCAGLGFYDGTPTCLGSCTISRDGRGCHRRCGDGTIDADRGELCDGGPPSGMTCRSVGFYGGTLECSSHCDGLVSASCVGRCGDGILQAAEGEVCDGDQLGTGRCADFGYQGGTLACAAGCKGFDRSACQGFCGDGVAQGTEECDGLDHRGASCMTLGSSAGALFCKADCRRDFSQCVSQPAWTHEHPPTHLGKADAFALPGGEVFVAGGPLVERLVGGRWVGEMLQLEDLVARVWAAAANDAWAVGSGENAGFLMHFDGTSWTSKAPAAGLGTMGYTVWGSGPNDVYASGTTGLFRWNGATWTSEPKPAGSVTDLSGTGPSDLWAVMVEPGGATGLYYRGASGWVKVALEAGFRPRSVRAFSEADVFVAGVLQVGSGVYPRVVRYDGQQWTSMGFEAPGPAPEGNPRVWGAAGTDLYLTASKELFHFDGNAQFTWKKVSGLPATSGNFTAGAAVGPGNAFLVGSLGYVAHLEGGQWHREYETTPALRGVWGATADDLFAVGDGPRIWRYDGHAWGTVPSAAPALNGVWGRGPAEVYAVGGAGAILRYRGDPAEGFVATPSPTTETLHGIAGRGATAFAVGGGGTILSQRPDGSWERMPVPAAAASLPLYGVWLNPDGSAFAAGGDDTLLRLDGGAWTCVRCGLDPALDFVALWGTSADSMFLGGGWGGNPAFWRFGASAFDLVISYDSYGGQGLALWGRSPADFYASSSFFDGVGEVRAFDHWNGIAWSQVQPGFTMLGVLGMWGSGPTDLITVGEYGQIARLRPPGWTPFGAPGASALYAAWGPGDGTLLAVGAGGAIHRHAAGAWTASALPSASALRGIWGSSAAEVWAVGDGVVARLQGATWTETAVPERLRAVSGSASTSVLAVGEAGAALRYDGAWSTQALPTTAHLNGVAVFAPDDAVVVGEGGAMLRRGASGWSVVDSTVTSDLNAVAGTMGSEVIAVGDGGVALHCDRVGCVRMSTGTSSDLLALLVTGPQSAFATGVGGVVLHFDGTRWAPMRNSVLQALNGLASGGGNLVYAVGAQGVALVWSGALPTVYGGSCAYPSAAYCGATLSGATAKAPARALPLGCPGASQAATPKVFYVLEVPAAGEVRVQLTAHDATLGLTAMGAGAYGACDPKAACLASSATTGPGQAEVRFVAQERGRYFLAVDAQAAPSGYALSVTCPRP